MTRPSSRITTELRPRRYSVRILENAVTPAMRPVADRDEHGESTVPGSFFGRIRIQPEDPDLAPKTATGPLAGPSRPGHACVGVVRMQLKPHALALEGSEVFVRVEGPQLKHAGIEGATPRDVADDEVQAETRKRSTVVGGAHPRFGLPLLHHLVRGGRYHRLQRAILGKRRDVRGHGAGAESRDDRKRGVQRRQARHARLHGGAADEKSIAVDGLAERGRVYDGR